VASAQLNPDLLSRLELEGIWAENGAFRWHGSFWGDSSWPGGSLQIDLSRYDSGTEGLWRGLAMWQRDIWSLGFGNTDYAGNTLQEPVEEPGVLFRLQGAGKVTSLFWHPGLPGYFSYRKGGSALTFLMAKKHDFWFYGRSEGGDEKGRVYGEVGMPVAWRIPSSTVSVRLGGQSRTPVSLWVLDWLQAGTETKGRYEDLWRLSVSGQNRPFLFSLYSQYNDLASDPAVVQEREDYAALGLNFPLERGSVTARWGYGVRQEEEEKEEQYGWELVTNKYWGPAHLYLAHNQLPLSLPRDYLRFGFYGKSHSLWLAAAKQSELKELEIGLLYRRQNRNWEFEWQAQENGQFSQAVGVKLTQPFAQRHKLQLGSKLFFHGESPATWEVTVGYGLNTKLPVPFLKTKGRLIGRIFVDENHDGIWQEGEKGISGCGILLDGELVVSQSDGQYEFGSMTPGEYPLFLQAQDLPLGFLPKAVTAAFVRLMAGEETSFDWPLTPGALLKGTLSVSGSQGVYLLLLKDNKVVARAVTASGGSFQFPYVLPGKYQLALAGGQFAASYRLSETEATLKEGEQELNLVLKEEEKPVEQLFRTPEWQVFEVH
jgi:hypothetical protein